jgi:hypothetical protein
MSEQKGLEGLSISDAAKKAIQRFGEQMHALLGDNLVSVELFGGVVRGEGRGLSVLVVLNQVAGGVLDGMIEPIAALDKATGAAPLIITEAELKTSTDVFPNKFLDIQRYHRTLAGRDVMATLEISTEHLRLRCEQEVRNLALRLRRAYVEHARNEKDLLGTLLLSAEAFKAIVETVHEVVLGSAPASPASAVTKLAAELDLEAGALAAVDKLDRKSRLGLGETKALFDRFMTIINRVVDAVDQA